MLLEMIHIGEELLGRTLAGTKSNSFGGLIDGNQVKFSISFIPEALDSMGDGEIADPAATSFFIKLGRQFLQGTAFDIRQTLISFIDEFLKWPKSDRGNRICQCREP